MDTLYPLPHKFIKVRYEAIFTSISAHLSGSFVGTYKSPKSGITKHILENPQDYPELLDSSIKYIYFEPTPIVGATPYYWLQQLNMAVAASDTNYQPVISEDPSVVLSSLQKYVIDNFKAGRKTTFLLNKLDQLFPLSQDVGAALNLLYGTLRQTPNNACSLWFYLSGLDPVSDPLPEFLKQLIYPLRESAIYFPELSEEETVYTVDRFATQYGVKLGKQMHAEIYRFSGGNYSLIFDAIQLAHTTRKTLDRQFLAEYVANHSIITTYLERFVESFAFEKRKQLLQLAKGEPIANLDFFQHLGLTDRSGKLKSAVLLNYVKHLPLEHLVDPTAGILTERERLVYELLKEKSNQLVTREEIADIVWSKDDETRFSLWAQDKVFSRLRRKIALVAPQHKLVVVKGRGVMLCQR